MALLHLPGTEFATSERDTSSWGSKKLQSEHLMVRSLRVVAVQCERTKEITETETIIEGATINSEEENESSRNRGAFTSGAETFSLETRDEEEGTKQLKIAKN
uniref:Uncharacterized protein n=1 Tax=Salix viminalis TaxID=40686 RepID=A0A6N2MJW8_SALVM